MIVLLFFVVDEDRGGTCQSGKTENSGKPRTVKVECIPLIEYDCLAIA